MFRFINKIFIGLLACTVNTSNHRKCVSLSNQKCTTHLIYILMNTLKDYVTIHLSLIYIDVLEVAILLMIYLINHVFQKNKRLKSKYFQHDHRNN